MGFASGSGSALRKTAESGSAKMLADPPSCPPHGKRPVGYPVPTGTLNHSITNVLGARADPRAGRCQVQPLLRSLWPPLHTEGQHGGPHAHTHRTQVISAYRISGRRLDLATGYQRPDTIRPKMQLGTYILTYFVVNEKMIKYSNIWDS